MSTRATLQEELRLLEGSMKPLTREQKMRVKTLAKQLRNCICRHCGEHYDENKSRADYKGFCSASCLHEKSRSFGYRKNDRTEYDFLKKHQCIGSDYVIK